MSEHDVDFAIGGMTCASCAARVEKKLNAMPGVVASVNLATEKAHVTLADGVTPQDCVTTVERTGYSASLVETGHVHGAADDAQDLRRRLAVSVILAVPVVLLSMMMAMDAPVLPWILWALTTPVVVWGAWPFHRSAWAAGRHGGTTMDTLISLGVGVSYLWSTAALFLGGHLYFEVAVTVTVFLLTGRYAEAKAKRRAGEALDSLLRLGAKEVTVLRDGRETRIAVEELVVGDTFVVRPGEQIATDGLVVEGAAAVDAALVTGESLPVDVGPGDPVIGATVNTDGRIVVRAERVGAQTQLAQIARAVEQAQSGKAPVQRLADRVSGVFVPTVLVLSLVTLSGWLLSGAGWQEAMTAAVSVLIIACPCALGLATPTALLVGTGRGAQMGILIRGPEVLEATRAVDTVVFDKTGTLTQGRVAVVAVDSDEPDFARKVGTLESASQHPLAVAIAAHFPERGTLSDFTATHGGGVTGTVDGVHVVAGSPRWLRERWGLDVSDGDDRSVVAVAWEGQVRGCVLLADGLRQESPGVVRELRSLGLEPVLLTGDTYGVARSVADQCGIERVVAQVRPEEKMEAIRGLQDDGRTVAMVGDGVNDAAALAQADLGVAMGAGSDVAIAASDITLIRDDPADVVDAIRLSRSTLRTIKGNLFWAFAYNTAAIPLAMAGLLEPMIAGAAMAFSSVFVVLNSLRLRRFRSWREPTESSSYL